MAKNQKRTLAIVSYNLHGFNQGFSTVRDLSLSIKPDIFLLQEHWLTPCNLSKFGQNFPGYFSFGSSAMTSRVESGLMSGRPYGGVMILIKNDLQKLTRTLYSSDRCIVVKVCNYIIVDVYLPCVGTVDRMLIIDDVLNEVSNYIADYSSCTLLLGGDFNCDLDGPSQAAELINQFVVDSSLYRCSDKAHTYINTALNCSSCIDYFFISNNSYALKCNVIDDGSNLSDHLPIFIECQCVDVTATSSSDRRPISDQSHLTYLRWDHADINSYYLLTGHHLQSLLNDFNSSYSNISLDNSRTELINLIDKCYDCIVNILCETAKLTVPTRSKQFYKFWWDQEMDCLKEDSISTHNLWKSAGKPRSGPLFAKARSAKMLYKKRIKECQRQETSSYTNDLHDALISKQGNAFWRCWRAKFDSNSRRVVQVDGLTDETGILNSFEQYFINTCSNLSAEGSRKLTEVYHNKRKDYCGLPFDEYLLFDAGLVEKSISSLGRGKAAGLDNLTAEHLQHSHPALCLLLSKLFNAMIEASHVPPGFGLSYTVPLPKCSYATVSKSLTVDDFRGISISAALSKVFEKCILDRYARFFETSDNQFGFKKGIGCSHAIYSVRCAVNHFVSRGSTVNLCALDLRKAFDKMNHHGLFTKLMVRMLPNALLSTLEYWFSICSTRVRWGDSLSNAIFQSCGVRQGGCLSAYLFAVYIDDIIKIIQHANIGCRIGLASVGIFLYADDIVLLAPSLNALQTMLTLCELHLAELDMALNAKKSACIRFGPRFKDECCSLTTLSGETLCWVDNLRYLGVYLVAAKKFKCSLSNNKKCYYRAFNAILSKVGNCASEVVLVKLLSAKCLPVFVYGLDACPVSKSDSNTLDFVMTRTFMRIFKTGSIDIVHECQHRFNFANASDIVTRRKRNFLTKFSLCENSMCVLFKHIANNELLILH